MRAKVVHLPSEEGFSEAWSVEVSGHGAFQTSVESGARWLAQFLNDAARIASDSDPTAVQLNPDGTWFPLNVKKRNKPKKKEGDSKGEAGKFGKRGNVYIVQQTHAENQRNFMANITEQPRVELTLKFTVTEAEARALDALVGYGDDGFIECFYKNMGSHYLKPHEDGLRLFFKSIRAEMPAILCRVDKARKAFTVQ